MHAIPLHWIAVFCKCSGIISIFQMQSNILISCKIIVYYIQVDSKVMSSIYKIYFSAKNVNVEHIRSTKRCVNVSNIHGSLENYMFIFVRRRRSVNCFAQLC